MRKRTLSQPRFRRPATGYQDLLHCIATQGFQTSIIMEYALNHTGILVVVWVAFLKKRLREPLVGVVLGSMNEACGFPWLDKMSCPVRPRVGPNRPHEHEGPTRNHEFASPPLHWALEPQREILMFMWNSGPLQEWAA